MNKVDRYKREYIVPIMYLKTVLVVRSDDVFRREDTMTSPVPKLSFIVLY